MRRIIVIGVPGAGKSTFSRKLGEKLDLPVHHLDRYFWRPGWQETPRDEFDRTLVGLMETDAWILDGIYRRTIPLRLQYADTAILMDVPRRHALYRVAKRVVRYRNGGRVDMTEGCPERWFDLDFVKYIWRFHQTVLPEVEGYLDAFEKRAQGTVIRLRSDAEAQAWLDTVNQTTLSAR